MSLARATESTGRGAGVELLDHGRVDALGQLALDRGDLVADVLQREVAVDLELELEDHRGDALVVARGHALDAAQRLQRLLDRVGDLRLHRLRVGARVDDGRGDDRELDVREQLDADARQAVEAEHHERGDHHRREHGPADRDLCDLHGDSLATAGLRLALATGPLVSGLAAWSRGGRGGGGGVLGRRTGLGRRLELDLDVHAGAQQVVGLLSTSATISMVRVIGSTVGWMRTTFASRVASTAVK
jgi:hypothetical protein